ncbi:hydantoinase B/oxoprolinase family protein [Candidatus Formimonas warabiya]|uniref:5-oxoprolinase n=1 Tax=Formimonas warabiya TaxID=1761012 RepID=A0A3G1KR99_FORW1|nr:hydantoinase B/oxoprolinase family protein [Candidatus Formimonas warabiya]ATW24966.1 5-oxoprolinase [Candidatus Formimonas warabiya]
MPNIAIDGVTLEVMRNALQSIAEEMGVTLIRTALSINIKDRRDCSTAIYTPQGDLVAQAEHIPLHLGLMPTIMKAVLKAYPPNMLKPGDAIMINDPYISGSHLPDVCVFSPVFFDRELVAIVANLAHHCDIGGMAPGGMPVNATEIFQEGIRIAPVKVRKEGKLDEELVGFITNNVRTAFEFRGDMEAQLAANNVGEKRIKELAQKCGAPFIKIYMEEMLNYSERRMRARIKEMKPGVYAFEDFLEMGEADLIPIKVAIAIEDDHMTVDFTGTGGQVKGSLNCTRGVTLACVYYAVKAMTDPEIPSNGGAFRPVEVITPAGTVVNPQFPAAVSNANINTSQRITDCMLGAMAQVRPDRAMAACAGTMSLLTIGGIDPRTGTYYSYVETYGGGMGAVHNLDGMDGVHTNMTNTRNTPTEVMEMAFPLFVNKYSLIPESDGPGKYRGGLGLTREIVILDHEAHVTISTERSFTEPWGLFGGKPGRNSHCLLEQDGAVQVLPARITTVIPANSKIIYQTPGAGGMGAPWERDPQDVLRDVMEGFISVERAKTAYGVAINAATLEIEENETRKLRQEKLSA